MDLSIDYHSQDLGDQCSGAAAAMLLWALRKEDLADALVQERLFCDGRNGTKDPNFPKGVDPGGMLYLLTKALGGGAYELVFKRTPEEAADQIASSLDTLKMPAFAFTFSAHWTLVRGAERDPKTSVVKKLSIHYPYDDYNTCTPPHDICGCGSGPGLGGKYEYLKSPFKDLWGDDDYARPWGGRYPILVPRSAFAGHCEIEPPADPMHLRRGRLFPVTSPGVAPYHLEELLDVSGRLSGWRRLSGDLEVGGINFSHSSTPPPIAPEVVTEAARQFVRARSIRIVGDGYFWFYSEESRTPYLPFVEVSVVGDHGREHRKFRRIDGRFFDSVTPRVNRG